MVDCEAPAEKILDSLKSQHGVLAFATKPHRIRFVTHRDLDDASVDRCLEALRACAQRP